VLAFPTRDIVGTDVFLGAYELLPTLKFFIELVVAFEIALIVFKEFSTARRFFDLPS